MKIEVTMSLGDRPGARKFILTLDDESTEDEIWECADDAARERLEVTWKRIEK